MLRTGLSIPREPHFVSAVHRKSEANVILLETPGLEEAHLPGFVLEIQRTLCTELLYPNTVRETVPILLRFRQAIINPLATNTALLQVGTNSCRSFALADSRLYKRLDESLVALQTIVNELGDRICSSVGVESELRHFGREFSPSVLTPGEIVHRLFAGFDGIGEFLVFHTGFRPPLRLFGGNLFDDDFFQNRRFDSVRQQLRANLPLDLGGRFRIRL